jgi:hypothetical protein
MCSDPKAVHVLFGRVNEYKRDQIYDAINIFLVIHSFVLNALDPYFAIKPSQSNYIGYT